MPVTPWPAVWPGQWRDDAACIERAPTGSVAPVTSSGPVPALPADRPRGRRAVAVSMSRRGLPRAVVGIRWLAGRPSRRHSDVHQHHVRGSAEAIRDSPDSPLRATPGCGDARSVTNCKNCPGHTQTDGLSQVVRAFAPAGGLTDDPRCSYQTTDPRGIRGHPDAPLTDHGADERRPRHSSRRDFVRGRE
jgi:hypothetical protein